MQAAKIVSELLFTKHELANLQIELFQLFGAV